MNNHLDTALATLITEYGFDAVSIAVEAHHPDDRDPLRSPGYGLSIDYEVDPDPDECDCHGDCPYGYCHGI
jgi:hypothetical protein